MRRFCFALVVAFCLSAVPWLNAQSPQVTLSRSNGLPKVGLAGQVGQYYNIESATSLASSNWNFQVGMPLLSSPQSWYDSSAQADPQRFYRAVKLDSPPSDFPSDFRLLDQLGRSRSLYYYLGDTNFSAVVLIFTGNGCQKIADMIPTIKSLTNRFGANVLFWLVDSNEADNRSNILAQAISLGISNGPPILDDTAQLVARAYNATTTPEAIAISTSDLNLFYRGAIDDRIGTNIVPTTQFYLSNALVNFLANAPVSPARTRPAGCAITLTAPFTNISYSGTIAPLLQQKCVRCHTPGNIAPWDMTNYGAVYSNSTAIKAEILAGRMPPWKADPYYGQFTNDFSLTTDEAKALIQWIDDGAYKAPAESDPLANLPPATNYPFAWPADLGQPDAILSIPVQNIPSSGVVNYVYVNITANSFGSNVWLRAAVIKPGNTRVVHHSLVFDGSTQGQGLDGFFAGYVPGADATSFPSGTGKYLTNGQTLQFQMHYITIGTPQTDQTQLGLYLLPSPPASALLTKSAYNVSFLVPGNAPDYQATATYPASGTLTTNMMLYEMSPHMHLRGSRFKYEVTYPAGHIPASEVLLSVPSYVFHWQSMFRLTTPKYIPKGSRITCTAGWDNTIHNGDLMEAYADSSYTNSQLSPATSVYFGQQTFNEMFIGYLNYAEVP